MKALRFLESSMDKICSALIIFLLLITVGLFAVFTALEVSLKQSGKFVGNINVFNKPNLIRLCKLAGEGLVPNCHNAIEMVMLTS